ncbi:DUF1033 family protein [Brochothrix campestris]|uniref:DUF1033 family protein n=1 Tax=Brochothrix campestris FSL F6-1037 TaxID=1265861 RepID=W7CTN3_9LIST|nr:DUF1033 family protein [Brochothrix campestris]EUJ39191.1 hypothetical protein BCAMP_07910 [Brochothrix campestris FSL F6-1037]
MHWTVIETESFNEPWWFFEDWREDIISERQLATESLALTAYQSAFERLATTYPYHQVKEQQAAFWCEEEKSFCEECDDDLQVFHGLLLLKDGKSS